MDLQRYLSFKTKEIYHLHNNDFFVPVFTPWVLTPEHISDVLNPKECAEKTILYLQKILEESVEFTCVKDFSIINKFSHSHNLQIIKDDYSKNLSLSICINISVIIPFYHLHILGLNRKKENFSKWDGLPKRNKEMEELDYYEYIVKIRTFLEKDLNLTAFPEHMIDEVVPEIWTEDIRKGEFTYYNAFFQKEFDTR